MDLLRKVVRLESIVLLSLQGQCDFISQPAFAKQEDTATTLLMYICLDFKSFLLFIIGRRVVKAAKKKSSYIH